MPEKPGAKKYSSKSAPSKASKAPKTKRSAEQRIENAAAVMATVSAAQKAEVLIEALPYIQRFWDKNIVVKYGGNPMTDVAAQEDFAEDITPLKVIGMNPVGVHGGGPEVNKQLSEDGKESQVHP